MVAAKPCNEAERVAALRRYEILDTPPEPGFDDIARLAAHICQTPVAAVNFIDSGRQWFKAEVGLGVRETPLDSSICCHALLQPDVFIVPDTLLDPRFRDNPLCCSGPGLRFYAGALLKTSDGLPLGTLCVLDYVPRQLTASQKDALRMLSRQVMTQLELRLNLKALHASEAFSRTVMESSPDCVKVLDLSGRILHMNGEGCRQMEIDDFSVCRNQNWLDFWRGAEREAAAAALEAARAGGKGEFSGYCPTMKGMPRYWNVALAPILDEGGDPVQLICSSRDITDRRLTEEKLQDAAKLESLGVMAGGIAHDFNNLLTGILGFASVLAEAVSPRDRHMTDHIISAAERAADLTRQLLAYSGKGQFEIRAVDLSAELRDMLRIIEPIVENNIRLSLELDDHLPSLNGDPEQIRQLVINLVVNASEAMNGRPGTITLRTAPVPSGEISSVPYVLLEVCDNGCGMDEETRARIFDPFFTTKFVGRGLGLAAVSGIVRGHNGILRVESEVGKGTIFRVFFPAVVSAQPEPELPTETKDIIGRGTVLIVDDEEMVRKVGKTALERAGYEVRLASDGREAVEMFSAEPEAYSLILLDMTMPVMNGEEALGLLREIRPDVPVIVSSGYNEAEVLRHFPSGALAAFIQKPYSASRLADRVDSVLAERAQLATSAS